MFLQKTVQSPPRSAGTGAVQQVNTESLTAGAPSLRRTKDSADEAARDSGLRFHADLNGLGLRRSTSVQGGWGCVPQSPKRPASTQESERERERKRAKESARDRGPRMPVGERERERGPLRSPKALLQGKGEGIMTRKERARGARSSVCPKPGPGLKSESPRPKAKVRKTQERS